MLRKRQWKINHKLVILNAAFGPLLLYPLNMDKITDFFQGLKERLNNPLIGSFIIAWLIINWQVPIGIIFYGNETLAVDGFKSKIDLIKNNYSETRYFWLPLLAPLCYILSMPILRNLIQAYNTWKRRWGTNWNLKISKGGSVPVEKLIEVSTENESTKKVLANLINAAATIDNEKRSLENQLLELQSQKEISDQAQMNSYKKTVQESYNGTWKIRFANNPYDHQAHEEVRVEISSGSIILLQNTSAGRTLFKITNIFYNISSDEICMGFEDPTNRNIFFEIFSPLNRGDIKVLQNRSSSSHKRILGLIKD